MREGKGWSSVTEFLRNQVESETVAHWHRAAQPPARLPNAGHLILGTRTFFKSPKPRAKLLGAALMLQSLGRTACTDAVSMW